MDGFEAHSDLEPAFESIREACARGPNELGMAFDDDARERPNEVGESLVVLPRHGLDVEEVTGVVELHQGCWGQRTRPVEDFGVDVVQNLSELRGQRAGWRRVRDRVAPEIAEDAGERALPTHQEDCHGVDNGAVRLPLELTLMAERSPRIGRIVSRPERPNGLGRQRPKVATQGALGVQSSSVNGTSVVR